MRSAWFKAVRFALKFMKGVRGMDNDILEKKAFEAIHDLKSDVALLSGCVDRLSSIESVEGETSGKIEIIDEFLKEYNVFLDKYEESVNDKIRLFVAEVKNIVVKRKAEFMAIGIDVAEDGRLTLLDAKCKSKNVAGMPDDEEDTIFGALTEALFNAEVHMERFIPVKYLSYDSSKDYRILKQEGNIYTRGV